MPGWAPGAAWTNCIGACIEAIGCIGACIAAIVGCIVCIDAIAAGIDWCMAAACIAGIVCIGWWCIVGSIVGCIVGCIAGMCGLVA